MNFFFFIGLVVTLWKIYESVTESKGKSMSSRYQVQDLFDEWDDLEDDSSFASEHQINNTIASESLVGTRTVLSSSSMPRSSESLVSRYKQVQKEQKRNQEQVQSTPRKKTKVTTAQVKKAFVYREVLGAPRAINPYSSRRYPR